MDSTSAARHQQSSARVSDAVESQFTEKIEKVVESYMEKWQDRDEENNFKQAHDVELAKDELRPVVFEEIRQQVDAEVSIMLQNLKVCMSSCD